MIIQDHKLGSWGAADRLGQEGQAHCHRAMGPPQHLFITAWPLSCAISRICLEMGHACTLWGAVTLRCQVNEKDAHASVSLRCIAGPREPADDEFRDDPTLWIDEDWDAGAAWRPWAVYNDPIGMFLVSSLTGMQYVIFAGINLSFF